MNDLESVGRILQAKRKERELTQESVAEAVGITHGPLSRIENGQPTTTTTLMAIANHLGLHIAVLPTQGKPGVPNPKHFADCDAEIALLDWWRDLKDDRREWAEAILRGMGWSPEIVKSDNIIAPRANRISR